MDTAEVGLYHEIASGSEQMQDENGIRSERQKENLLNEMGSVHTQPLRLDAKRRRRTIGGTVAAGLLPPRVSGHVRQNAKDEAVTRGVLSGNTLVHNGNEGEKVEPPLD